MRAEVRLRRTPPVCPHCGGRRFFAFYFAVAGKAQRILRPCTICCATGVIPATLAAAIAAAPADALAHSWRYHDSGPKN